MINAVRKQWIDEIRALAIILVVLGHQLPEIVFFSAFINPIKMPLFFAISGYLFNKVNVEFSEFIRGVVNKLVIPWITLGLIVTIPQLYDGIDEFLTRIKYLILGKDFWFMPCLIIGEIILYFLLKIKNNVILIFSIFLCTTIGLILGNYKCLDLWMFNRALSVQLFFFMGIIFRRYENNLISYNFKWLLIPIILYITLVTVGLVFYPFSSIDIHQNYYFNLPLNFITIFTGTITCFTLFAKLNRSNKMLSIIGQNSLVIYIFHGLILGFTYRVIGFFGIEVYHNILLGIISTIYACVVCTIISLFINKYFPALLGRR